MKAVYGMETGLDRQETVSERCRCVVTRQGVGILEYLECMLVDYIQRLFGYVRVFMQTCV